MGCMHTLLKLPSAVVCLIAKRILVAAISRRQISHRLPTKVTTALWPLPLTHENPMGATDLKPAALMFIPSVTSALV